MSALQRFLGRDEKFFRLLESSVSEAKTATGILVRLLAQIAQGAVDATMGDLAQSRRKHKRISQEVTELLCKQFVTPFEREDIEALSSALYKITKNVEKIGERLTICPPGADLNVLTRQVSLLEQASNVVVKMIAALRARSHGPAITDEYERLQAIESDADRLMNDLLRDLYRGDSDARAIVFWKDIFELLEKGIDRCRDAGYVVFHVVLKNS
jgi:uncharacterized protein